MLYLCTLRDRGFTAAGGHLLFSLLLALSGLVTLPAQGQIVPDNTLGGETSRVRALDAANDLIDQGAIRGSNLFHSFEQFSIEEGRGAYFANPGGIENILSRVTGETRSDIFGTLGVLGDANLFLLNPNGVIFGPNAQLDIRGSFVVSTADSFLFPDGLRFSAVDPSAAPLLTLSVTPGLQYGSGPSEGIVNEAALLVGGDFSLSGGSVTSTGQLAAPNGHLIVEGTRGDVAVRWLAAQSATLFAANDVLLQESQLGTIADLQILAGDTVVIRDTAQRSAVLYSGGDLLIQGNGAVDIFALSHLESGLFSQGDMTLRSSNPVGGDAHYWTGGDFRIESLNGELGRLFSPYDPVIRALGDVAFEGYAGTSLHILAAGSVSANLIAITGPEDGPPNGAEGVDYLVVPAPGLSLALPGNPSTGAIDGSLQPTLDIRAGMRPEAVGTSPTTVLGSPISGFDGPFSLPPQTADIFFSDVLAVVPPPAIAPATSADITISDIIIAQPDGKVLVTNAYEPNLDLPGGSIRLGDLDQPPFSGLGFVGGVGIVTAGTGGDGGDVIVAARQGLELDTRGILASSDSGQAGNIALLAGDDIVLDSAFLLSSGVGSGEISLTSYGGDIRLDNTIVAGFTSGAGSAGDITLDGGDIFLDNGTAIINATTGTTQGGSVQIQASGLLSITDRGNPRTIPVGNLNDPVLALTNQALPEGTGITANTIAGSAAGGDIIVDVGQLSITNLAPAGSENSVGITSVTLSGSSGNAGNIEVTADVIEITGNDPTPFNPAQEASGLVDIIQIPTGITSATNGTGQAGTLTVNTDTLVLRDRAGLTSGNSFASDGGAGNRLQVNVVESIDLQGLAVIASGTVGDGDSGDVVVTTSELTLRDGAIIAADTFGSGNAGNVTVDADQISVFSGARIGASTDSSGDAGQASSLSANRILVDGVSSDGSVPSRLFFSSTSDDVTAEGNAGGLTITAQNLTVQNGGEVAGDTENTGGGGFLSLSAGEEIQVLGAGSRISFESRGVGDADGIEISAGQVLVDNQGTISASTSGDGDAGGIDIDAEVLLTIDNQGTISASTTGNGDAGGIDIDTAQLLVDNQGTISASTIGDGDAGGIDINTDEALTIDNQGSVSVSSLGDADATGNAGTLTLVAQDVSVLGGGRVEGDTRSAGLGGLLSVEADTLRVAGDESAISFATQGTGDADGIEISAEQVWVDDQGTISASTTSDGDAGGIVIDAEDLLTIDNQGTISASTTGNGDAGGIDIDTAQLLVDNQGTISASTTGDGDAGGIFIAVEDLLTIDNQGVVSVSSFEDMDETGTGNAGTLTLVAQDISVIGGGRVEGDTNNAGFGGLLSVDADTLRVAGRGSAISFESRGTGDADGIEISAGQVSVVNRGTISASTTGDGNAGGIDINTGQLLVSNRGTISVSSGEGIGIAGDLTITADSIFLNQQAQLSTETRATQGGNIRLQVTDSIILRNDGNPNQATAISARAFGAANGGNIVFDVGGDILAILEENSDVLAAAEAGEGGTITGEARFVQAFRDFQGALTPESDFTATASVGVDGTVDVETTPPPVPEDLPEVVEETTVSVGCDIVGQINDSDQPSSFLMTRRGGIPPSAADPVGEERILEDVGAPVEADIGSAVPQIIEAQGWQRNAHGQVVLFAEQPRQIQTCRR